LQANECFMLKEIDQLFEDFNDLNVLIIGDVMIDSYLFGHVSRISPEAPVPVVEVKKRTDRLGGAANVALNVKALGANPILCSTVGKDPKSESFLSLLKKSDLNQDGIVRSEKRITTTKFRIIGNSTQMLRVDEEDDKPLKTDEEQQLIDRINILLNQKNIDVIVFQDYDKGVITKRIIEHTIALAGETPTVVDPKKRNFHHYKNTTLFKPNLLELQQGIDDFFDLMDKNKLERSAENMLEKLQCKYLLTTLSEHGVLISKKADDSFEHIKIPAHIRSIADVSGAGDTVVSVAALCLARNVSSYQMANISNLAGGLVCEQVGVVPIDKERLLAELKRIEGTKQ
jgi:rfaE bifunctional protein kinase chain/domain